MNVVSIKDIAEKVDYGLTEKAKDEKVGPKFLRITDIQDDRVNWDIVPYCQCDEKEFEKNKLEVGDIVFARTGATTGKSFLVKQLNQKAVFASYLIRLRLDNDLVMPEFVSYFFKSQKYWNQIYADSDGATLPSFNATKLKALKLPLPTLDEQKAIVAKLDRAQRLIEIDKEMLAKYDELIQSVFLEMFGDPVTNPKGWKKFKLNDLTKINSGSTPSRKKSEYFGGEINWVKTTEVSGGYIFESEETITELGLEESSCKLYPDNTILVAMYGQGKTRGNVGLLKIEAATNQACAAIYPSENFEPEFLFNYLKLQYDELRDMGRGGNQPNLNVGMIKDYEIILPPIQDQRKFLSVSDSIRKEKRESELMLNKSEELFLSLVQEAFNQ